MSRLKEFNLFGRLKVIVILESVIQQRMLVVFSGILANLSMTVVRIVLYYFLDILFVYYILVQIQLIKMLERRTLTPTQIRYLKIGPKAANSKILKKQLVDILELEKQQQFAQTSAENGNLNKIPKFTFGQFQKTVNNFGVLINKNFGTQTTLHQIQKFGKLAQQVDKNLYNQKDKSLIQQKNLSHRKGNKTDKRTFLKSIYSYSGQKIFVMLHSFSIEVKGDNYKQFLNFELMKMLLEHVNSSKLAKIVYNCLNIQNQEIGVDQNILYQKTHALKNNQQKYQTISYKFEKLGAEFKINLPYLQFSHIQSDFKQIVQIVSNKDILQIVSQEFDNVHDIVYKYFNHQKFIEMNGPIQTPHNQIQKLDQHQEENQQHEQHEEHEEHEENEQHEEHEQNQQNVNQNQQNQQSKDEYQEINKQENEHIQQNTQNKLEQQQNENLLYQKQEVINETEQKQTESAHNVLATEGENTQNVYNQVSQKKVEQVSKEQNNLSGNQNSGQIHEKKHDLVQL